MTGSSTKVFGELRPGETDFAANLNEHDWQLSEYGDPMLMVISGEYACATLPITPSWAASACPDCLTAPVTTTWPWWH